MLDGLTTAHVADACLRLGIAPRAISLQPVVRGTRVHGRAIPVQHFGSVDIFLEAIDKAAAGTILVVDNAGRRDEGCIGDLVSLEAQLAGIAAIVIWGCHRDTEEITRLAIPLFSLGAMLMGPTRLEPRSNDAFSNARIAEFSVGPDDYVVADDDGVLFVPAMRLEAIALDAAQIRQTEHSQAAAAKDGQSLRTQLHFNEYVEARAADPNVTFRQHLAKLNAAIEAGFS